MADDIVERLREKIITDAFAQGEITSGALAERLIRERLDAADEIERLRAALNEQIVSQQQLRGLIAQYSQRYVRMQEALKPFAYYAAQIPNDVSNTASASGTVGDLRAAKAALEGK